MDTHFGARTVPLTEKQALVDDVFRKVAARYDLMNDLMSGGLHRVWKEAAVTAIAPPVTDRPFALLDLAGGTGDISFRVLAAAGTGTRVTVSDINPDMLAVGRERAAARGETRATFMEADAQSLPFPDGSFDAVSIAFGIRNVPEIPKALAEARRVLRPGGRFVCLEFSQADLPGLDRLYDLYSDNLIPAMGRLVVGDAEPYRYLVESIRRFPPPAAFAAMMRAAGMERVDHRLLTGGIVALHTGWRL